MASQVCSGAGLLNSLRIYESPLTSRVPETLVAEQLDSTCSQVESVFTQGSQQFNVVRTDLCDSGPVTLDNPGPDPKRFWFSYWGDECLTQATWGVCVPQTQTEPPTAFRCGVLGNCPSAVPPEVNVWHDFTSYGFDVPNCVPAVQVVGSIVDVIFTDGFESM